MSRKRRTRRRKSRRRRRRLFVLTAALLLAASISVGFFVLRVEKENPPAGALGGAPVVEDVPNEDPLNAPLRVYQPANRIDANEAIFAIKMLLVLAAVGMSLGLLAKAYLSSGRSIWRTPSPDSSKNELEKLREIREQRREAEEFREAQ